MPILILIISSIIAVFVIIFELYFYKKLKWHYHVIEEKERNNSLETFKDCLLNESTEKNWIKKLRHSLGQHKNLSDIKMIIMDEFCSEIGNLRYYSNLGPAIGLLGTFAGMIFLLFPLLLAKNIEADLLQIVGGLFPIFSGGFFGIGIYAIGNRLQNNVLSEAEALSEKYLEIFIEAESELVPRTKEEAEHAFKRMILPVQVLLQKLEQVANVFNTFLQGYKNGNEIALAYNEGLKKVTGEFTDTLKKEVGEIKGFSSDLVQKIYDYEQKMGTQIQKYEEYDASLRNSAEKWETFYKKIDQIVNGLEKYVEVVGGLQIVSKDLQNVLIKLGEETRFNSTFENIDQLVMQISGHMAKLADMQDNFRQFLEKIPPGELITISSKISNLANDLDTIFKKNYEKFIGGENDGTLMASMMTLLERSNRLNDIFSKLEMLRTEMYDVIKQSCQLLINNENQKCLLNNVEKIAGGIDSLNIKIEKLKNDERDDAGIWNKIKIRLFGKE